MMVADTASDRLALRSSKTFVDNRVKASKETMRERKTKTNKSESSQPLLINDDER